MSTVLGYTTLTNTVSENDETLKVFVKSMVLADFAKKIGNFLDIYGFMLPNSTLTYDIIYNNYGINLTHLDNALNECEKHIDGEQISIDETIDDIIALNPTIEQTKEEIRKIFGRGEFPFITTDIYRYKDKDIITYYIIR